MNEPIEEKVTRVGVLYMNAPQELKDRVNRILCREAFMPTYWTPPPKRKSSRAKKKKRFWLRGYRY